MAKKLCYCRQFSRPQLVLANIIVPLPENAGLVYPGELAWAPALVSPKLSATLAAAPNPSGRPNGDVLRPFVHAEGARLRERWQIDFPPHYTGPEAALHLRPFARLKRKLGRSRANTWVNPHASAELRRTVALLDRFLVSPVASAQPRWTWVAAGRLADSSLLAFARDDDFTWAVLSSAYFGLWWLAHHPPSGPVLATAAFPFPWGPARPLGSLSARQQDQRQAAVRAVRSGDSQQINSAVAGAYGWPAELDPEDALGRLHLLHAVRVREGPRLDPR